MEFICCWVIQMIKQQSPCAEAALTKFVIQTHLAYSVKNCGPLWATSAFTFEATITVYQKCLTAQCVPKQIVETFLLKRKTVSASQILAIQNLLRTNLVNRSALLYERFIYNH